MQTTLPRLLANYKIAKAGQPVSTGLWTEPEWPAERFLNWFRDCLETKINSKDPRFPNGRKADGEYQIELGRIRRYIGNRIVIDWIAPVLGERVKASLTHRLRSY